jgi:hypothetical protein
MAKKSLGVPLDELTSTLSDERLEQLFDVAPSTVGLAQSLPAGL